MRRTRLGTACVLLMLAACSSSQPGGADPAELVVFAASSLTQGFESLGTDFEAQHPGVTVTFNFGPSDGLAAQIASEGSVDVFASASQTWMDDVQRAAGVTDRVDFVANELVLITPLDDPAHVDGLQDIAASGVQVVLAAEGVPVGDYAREMLRNAEIEDPVLENVVSNAEDDAAVVATIASGEADAGIVYGSDLTGEATTPVRSVDIPDDVNVIAAYPIAVVKGSRHPALAREWVAFVSTGDGQRRLVDDFGFLPVSTA